MPLHQVNRAERSELAAIVHGPALLARTSGLIVGLRSIVAFSTGLEISIVVRATGVHAEALARQYRAPAEIDRESSRPNPSSKIKPGLPMRFSAADDTTEQPVPRSDGEGFADRAGELYCRELLYRTSDLPSTTVLRYLVSWPQIGLAETAVALTIPDSGTLRRNIISLA